MRVETRDHNPVAFGDITFKTLQVRLDDGTLVGCLTVKRHSEEERTALEGILEAVADEAASNSAEFCSACPCELCQRQRI